MYKHKQLTGDTQIETISELRGVLKKLPKSERLNFVMQPSILAIVNDAYGASWILYDLSELDRLAFVLQKEILSLIDVNFFALILHDLPNKGRDFLSAIAGVEWPQDVLADDILIYQQSHYVCQKENLFNIIKTIPCIQDQIRVLEQCLNPDALLGRLFWQPRGKGQCDLNSGVLKEINDYVHSFKAYRVAAISFFKQSLNNDIAECNPVVHGHFFEPI
ncbi:MAG: hypothetical protein WAW86_07365 [Gammaproteobacteria bacterium]